MWHWINPENFRYYKANLVVDMFGDWTLVRAWGGLGTPRGNHRISGVSSYADGLRKIDELDAYRQRRGYVPVFSFGNWAAQIAEMQRYSTPSLPCHLEQDRGGQDGEL